MKTTFSFRTLAFSSLAVLTLGLTSCDKDDDLQEQPITEAPTSYNFQNANYSGQTVRLLLLKDLEAEMEKAKTGPVTKDALMTIYTNSDGRYADISTGKKLSDKVANTQDNQMIEDWFQEIETLSSQPGNGYVTADGVDLKQMVAKTIMGSVFYNRALNDYLDVAKLSDDDNATVTPGQGTEMEHHFDEGFGYFGAARNMNQFTDAEIVSPGRKDINGDGTFDPQAEVNYYYAQTAAKRDIDYQKFTSSQTNFTADIFESLVKGRYFVSKKSYTQRDQEVTRARALWDRMISATVIHYAGQVKTDLNGMGSNPTQAQKEDLAKHWSEMKAYFEMIKYNTDNKLGSNNFNTINTQLGTNSSTVSVGDIESAIQLLKTAYNF